LILDSVTPALNWIESNVWPCIVQETTSRCEFCSVVRPVAARHNTRSGWQNAFFNFGQEEQEEIKTNFSTLVDEGQAGVRQKGNIRSELYAWESFTPRLLFCKNNNVGDYETANIALDWEKEETGLLETRWKYWKRIWATRQEVSTEANFHLSMLDHVIRNIYRKYRCREGEFMIEEMRTEFKLNDIGKTKIKGYKFDYAPKAYTLQDMWEISDPIWIDETIDFDFDITLNY